MNRSLYTTGNRTGHFKTIYMQLEAQKIIDIANRQKSSVTFYDVHGYLGEEVYCIKYAVKDKVTLLDNGRLALHEDGIQFMPGLFSNWGGRIDERKKKKFLFEKYKKDEDLIIDLIKYIEDCTKNYLKPFGTVKQIQDKIDKECVKTLLQGLKL